MTSEVNPVTSYAAKMALRGPQCLSRWLPGVKNGHPVHHFRAQIVQKSTSHLTVAPRPETVRKKIAGVSPCPLGPKVLSEQGRVPSHGGSLSGATERTQEENSQLTGLQLVCRFRGWRLQRWNYREMFLSARGTPLPAQLQISNDFDVSLIHRSAA